MPPTLWGWRLQDLVATLLALALLLLWDFGGADLPLSRLFGNAEGFAWRTHWFTDTVLHNGGRWLGLIALLALVVNLRWPWTPSLTQRQRLAWCLGTLALLMLVPALKRFSLSSCPYELAEFGGVAQYVSHWRWGVADGGPGHCFPSGHATSALAFVGGYFALRQRYPLAARCWLATVLALGALYGWAQLARGAHFASHTLWSAWLCWTGALLMLGRQPVAQRSVPTPGLQATP
jgi:membrane-associated PAP2 superfamily phosphatase